MIYLQLFFIFFKIGLFGFGGGYAMLSMIQSDIVTQYHWLTMEQFTNIVAISQMTPGPIGLNCATYVGYTATGDVWGSILATFALLLPSFVIMIIVSGIVIKLKENPYVIALFQGLRPAIVGLLLAAVLLLMTPENFSTPTTDAFQFGVSIALFIGTFIATKWFRISPILMIVLSGIAGFFIYM